MPSFFLSTEILVQTQVMEHQIDYKQKYKALKKKLKFLVYVSMHLQIRGIRTSVKSHLVRNKKYFSSSLTKTYVVGTQKNHLNEMVLLSTQNI